MEWSQITSSRFSSNRLLRRKLLVRNWNHFQKINLNSINIVNIKRFMGKKLIYKESWTKLKLITLWLKRLLNYMKHLKVENPLQMLPLLLRKMKIRKESTKRVKQWCMWRKRCQMIPNLRILLILEPFQEQNITRM